ncbi:MAG: hypothetical protein M0R33_13700 [Methylomonas sp.]|uniref:hypothetical protein n=1 Tax=Methylomonas sp. TaxID=418 RepID=UPI0025CBB3AB|nr:hypothetical protein [Methylomonas sp.]MCK9607490.1 hypothetical protein [Methylomonas sp.]
MTADFPAQFSCSVLAFAKELACAGLKPQNSNEFVGKDYPDGSNADLMASYYWLALLPWLTGSFWPDLSVNRKKPPIQKRSPIGFTRWFYWS